MNEVDRLILEITDKEEFKEIIKAAITQKNTNKAIDNFNKMIHEWRLEKIKEMETIK